MSSVNIELASAKEQSLINKLFSCSGLEGGVLTFPPGTDCLPCAVNDLIEL